MGARCNDTLRGGWRAGRALAPALVLLWLATGPAAAEVPPSEAQPPIQIQIDSPAPGQIVRNRVDVAPVRGIAQLGGGDPLEFDVLLVMDISYSTRYPSGIDINQNGEVGFNPKLELVEPGLYPPDSVNSDPGDSILAAEVAAARLLLANLESAKTRVGIISFSGEVDPQTGERASFDQQDAWLDVPLTHDYAAVQRGLEEILARGPYGATNFAAGIRLAITELASLSGSKSPARPGTKKVMLFLTDGIPTFPIGLSNREDPGDVEHALNAARLARKAGISINTYALGSNALASPLAATEIARLSLGSYTPIQNPGDIVAFLQGVSFANVDDVVITNLTLKEVSYDVELTPDGSFAGFVPVREGWNRIQVTALASDGSEKNVELDLEFEKAGLTDRELAIELERIRKRNKELMLLLERERIRRFRERQRKVLEITADEDEQP
ncbi:MAG: VWA domain-containing protein [Proteobacteria bacterium]|nr:VWA domain-containing protein [Pseudomonadota bacterium]